MLKEMEYVYAVYREKSFSRAAKKLYISQPALSATIKKVENEIRTPIFDRTTNPIRLTQAGEFYIRSIEKIMAIQDEMREYFDGISELGTGEVDIGSPSYFCIYVLPELVRTFREAYPGITVNLMEGGALDLSEKLKNEKVDLVLEVENLNETTFEETVWDCETIILAVPASFSVNREIKKYRFSFDEIRQGRHLSTRKQGVDVGLFAEEPFLLLKKGNDLYRRAIAICKKHGFTPSASLYLDQLLTCYFLVCEGKGVAFIRDSVIRFVEETDKVCFYKIDDELARRTIKLFCRKATPLSDAARRFFDFMREKTVA